MSNKAWPAVLLLTAIFVVVFVFDLGETVEPFVAEKGAERREKVAAEAKQEQVAVEVERKRLEKNPEVVWVFSKVTPVSFSGRWREIRWVKSNACAGWWGSDLQFKKKREGKEGTWLKAGRSNSSSIAYVFLYPTESDICSGNRHGQHVYAAWASAGRDTLELPCETKLRKLPAVPLAGRQYESHPWGYVQRSPDGFVYQGELVSGIREGCGVGRWRDGGRYEGEWKANKRTGKGVLTWGSKTKWAGHRYRGQFKYNEMTGYGQYEWPNGGRHEGQFVKAQANGKGAWWNAKTFCYGTYSGGQLQGRGWGIRGNERVRC